MSPLASLVTGVCSELLGELDLELGHSASEAAALNATNAATQRSAYLRDSRDRPPLRNATPTGTQTP